MVTCDVDSDMLWYDVLRRRAYMLEGITATTLQQSLEGVKCDCSVQYSTARVVVQSALLRMPHLLLRLCVQLQYAAALYLYRLIFESGLPVSSRAIMCTPES